MNKMNKIKFNYLFDLFGFIVAVVVGRIANIMQPFGEPLLVWNLVNVVIIIIFFVRILMDIRYFNTYNLRFNKIQIKSLKKLK